jgi:hypothetical protein
MKIVIGMIALAAILLSLIQDASAQRRPRENADGFPDAGSVQSGPSPVGRPLSITPPKIANKKKK